MKLNNIKLKPGMIFGRMKEGKFDIRYEVVDVLPNSCICREIGLALMFMYTGSSISIKTPDELGELFLAEYIDKANGEVKVLTNLDQNKNE